MKSVAPRINPAYRRLLTRRLTKNTYEKCYPNPGLCGVEAWELGAKSRLSRRIRPAGRRLAQGQSASAYSPRCASSGGESVGQGRACQPSNPPAKSAEEFRLTLLLAWAKKRAPCGEVASMPPSAAGSLIDIVVRNGRDARAAALGAVCLCIGWKFVNAGLCGAGVRRLSIL